MRNQPAVTVRRADYQPPAYRIERIDLEFDLDPVATRVTTTLVARRNAVPPGTPLILDGEHLQLDWIELDGRRLGPGEYDVRGNQLAVRTDPALRDAAPLKLRIQNTIHPEKNTELMGLYMSHGNFFTQCEAEGFRRITFFPDRPDVMATYGVTLRADRNRYPVLLANGNRVGRRRSGRRPALRALGRSASQAQLPVRARRRPARVPGRHAAHAQRPRGAAAGLGRTGQSRQDRACDGVAQARDPLGRAALRPRARPRPFHDRRRQRLQHGRDGEQGPEHLQREVRSGQPADRHRHRLRQHRVDRRPRVLPQLDRQSRHLP